MCFTFVKVSSEKKKKMAIDWASQVGGVMIVCCAQNCILFSR